MKVKRHRLTFTAIDVETADSRHTGICQIGVVQVRDGEIQDTFSTLINPEMKFHSRNIDVHGINEDMVKDSPTLPLVEGKLRDLLGGQILVSHSLFDRSALDKALDRYRLAPIRATWLDSVKYARQAWPNRERNGYRLNNIARDLGISFQHHNAAEDARAVAEIVIQASLHTGVDIEDWLNPPNVSSPRQPTSIVSGGGNICPKCGHRKSARYSVCQICYRQQLVEN